MRTIPKLILLFLALTGAATLLMNFSQIQFGTSNFWETHGIFFLIFITIFPIIFGIQSVSSTRIKNNRWRQEEQKKQDQLLEKFKTSDYVPVRIVSHIRMKTETGYTVAPYPLREKLAMETVISPLGENIRIHEIAPWGDHDIYFDAQITKNAYDLLKQNHWVRNVILRDEN